VGASDPAASVVVPTHNRARRLEALLRSLREQTIGADRFEVIVVDDGSTDGTDVVLAAETATGILSLRTIRHATPSGPTAARNAGIAIARGPLIAFTDDDCIAEPGWLAAGIAAWDQEPMRFVQGATTPIEAEKHLLGPRSYSYEITEADDDYQTCNIFYPRELLSLLGGFDMELFSRFGGEDTDLAWRALAAGAQPVFARDAEVHHAVVELTMKSAVRRCWSWNATAALYVRHPELRRKRLLLGIFWNHHHYVTARMWAALLLPSRLPLLPPRSLLPLKLWLAKPWLTGRAIDHDSHSMSLQRTAWYAVTDTVEMVALARGSVPHRILVL
jgi:glycosyltransferase involved in cell wall biosynthesis